MHRWMVCLSVAALCSQGFAGYILKWSVPGFNPDQSSMFSENEIDYDVNSDGLPELFINDGPRELILDRDGNPVWDITPPSSHDVWRNSWPPFHICNTDGDPAKELVLELHRQDGPTLYYAFAVYDCDSRALEYTSPDMVIHGHCVGNCRVLDVDGDSRSEIAVFTGGATRSLDLYEWVSDGVDEGSGLTPEPARSMAIPSPSRQSVRFTVQRPEAGRFDVAVFDAAGRVVRVLRVDGRAGANPVVWDGCDGSGRLVPCGTYQYSADGEAGRLELVR
jgi:hypothetical protein